MVSKIWKRRDKRHKDSQRSNVRKKGTQREVVNDNYRAFIALVTGFR